MSPRWTVQVPLGLRALADGRTRLPRHLRLRRQHEDDPFSGRSLARMLPSTTERTNLAEDVTGFVGRREELAALDAAFGHGARLVTVVGPPGVGKTRLARHHGWLNLAPYARQGGGVWFCDLSDA